MILIHLMFVIVLVLVQNLLELVLEFLVECFVLELLLKYRLMIYSMVGIKFIFYKLYDVVFKELGYSE